MKTVLTACLSILLCSAAFSLFNSGRQKRIAYVDNEYIFSKFKMKQELETRLNEIKQLRIQELDSLYKVLEIVRKQSGGLQREAFETEVQKKRQRAFEEQEQLQQTYNTQIWKQLNELVKKYGQENDYDLIMGANGQGNLMHATSDLNISDQIVSYANEKYNGQ